MGEVHARGQLTNVNAKGDSLTMYNVSRPFFLLMAIREGNARCRLTIVCTPRPLHAINTR